MRLVPSMAGSRWPGLLQHFSPALVPCWQIVVVLLLFFVGGAFSELR